MVVKKYTRLLVSKGWLVLILDCGNIEINQIIRISIHLS